MTLEDRLALVLAEYGRENGFGELADGTHVKPTLKQVSQMTKEITSFYADWLDEYNDFVSEVTE